MGMTVHEPDELVERPWAKLTPDEYRTVLAASIARTRPVRFAQHRGHVVTHGGQRVTDKVYDLASARAVCQHLVGVTGKRHKVEPV